MELVRTYWVLIGAYVIPGIKWIAQVKHVRISTNAPSTIYYVMEANAVTLLAASRYNFECLINFV